MCKVTLVRLDTQRHLLCECVVAKDFWFNVRVPPDLVNSFANPDLIGWLKEIGRASCRERVCAIV